MLISVSIIFLIQVARLYRNGLKVLNSWAIDRDVFIDEATKLRARFDAERGCKPEKALRLLRVSKEKRLSTALVDHVLILFVF